MVLATVICLGNLQDFEMKDENISEVLDRG